MAEGIGFEPTQDFSRPWISNPALYHTQSTFLFGRSEGIRTPKFLILNQTPMPNSATLPLILLVGAEGFEPSTSRF